MGKEQGIGPWFFGGTESISSFLEMLGSGLNNLTTVPLFIITNLVYAVTMVNL